MSAAVQAALARVNEAEIDLVETFRRDYPPGAEIKWTPRINNYARGTVVRHGMTGRTLVKNAMTGGTYWIEPRKVGWK